MGEREAVEERRGEGREKGGRGGEGGGEEGM